MDSYKIEWKKSAVKELRKLGKKIIPKIITTVEGLAKDPLSGGVRRLIGSENTFRVRVGNYTGLFMKNWSNA